MEHTLSCFGQKLRHLCSCCGRKLACFNKSCCYLTVCFYRFVSHYFNSFGFQLLYFISVSVFGFWILRALPTRTAQTFRPRDLDLFFTSVSAVTVSSMSTVEMEVFSNSQLVVLTVLMFIGGEVFTSMVGLFFRQSKLSHIRKLEAQVVSVASSAEHSPKTDSNIRDIEEVELGVVVVARPDPENLESSKVVVSSQFHPDNDTESLLLNSIRLLAFIVLGYLIAVHVLGVAMVSLYIGVASTASSVLKKKKLNPFTFSVFTVVSTFASCGFVPTNENMMVFSKDSLLLLILIPQVLFGNTLYPPCLRACIVALSKMFKRKKDEFQHLLRNTTDIRYHHLLPGLRSHYLVGTVFAFIAIQLVMFCAMEWNSVSLSGLNGVEKFVGSLFQSVNSRHTGETIVDISVISPAILVLFVVMMYLPPYTSFFPVSFDQQHPQTNDEKRKGSRGKIVENLIFSQLSYLVIFVILICYTERKKIRDDPLNFSVLNIVVEVISAYGNVGFTTGYSCKRQLHPDGNCQDKWYGFAGRWSDGGKILLILVMFFGRLKKFNMQGGKAWKLL